MNILPGLDGERKANSLSYDPDGTDATASSVIPAAWAKTRDPDEPTPDQVCRASLDYGAAGLSLIPIDATSGDKRPDGLRLPRLIDPATGRRKLTWAPFQLRPPSEQDLLAWPALGAYGLAAVCGLVSGGAPGVGLEVIDLDTADLASPWRDEVERRQPGLIDRLVRVLSPRPGLHVWFRSPASGVSQKLACDPAGKTLIETRGEGGYCLVPPSPAGCHPSGRLYRYVEESPTLGDVPTITARERQVLLDAARRLDRAVRPKGASRPCERTPAGSRPSIPGEQRPGDDFNARATWGEVLTPHGWTLVGTYGDEGRWRRPGKGEGISATTDHDGNGRLHVFSSNAEPFEAGEGYTRFAAYALLDHGGDFAAAARELARQGYGSPRAR